MIINITLDTTNDDDVQLIDVFQRGLAAAMVPVEAEEVVVEEVVTPPKTPKDKKPPKPRKPRAKKPAPKVEEKPDITPAPEATVGGDAEFTLDEVRASFRTFVEANSIEDAAAKLAEFDAARLSDLPEEKWGEFVASLNG